MIPVITFVLILETSRTVHRYIKYSLIEETYINFSKIFDDVQKLPDLHCRKRKLFIECSNRKFVLLQKLCV